MTTTPIINTAAGSASTAPTIMSGPGGFASPATTTSSMFSTGITMATGVATNVYITKPYRRPRKPREKRVVPLLTAGLEAKLNKTLDQDAAKIIRFLGKKVGAPTVTKEFDVDVYDFSQMFTYAIQTAIPFTQMVAPSVVPTSNRHTVKFHARLYVRSDGTLCEYEVKMGGTKR